MRAPYWGRGDGTERKRAINILPTGSAVSHVIHMMIFIGSSSPRKHRIGVEEPIIDSECWNGSGGHLSTPSQLTDYEKTETYRGW